MQIQNNETNSQALLEKRDTPAQTPPGTTPLQLLRTLMDTAELEKQWARINI